MDYKGKQEHKNKFWLWVTTAETKHTSSTDSSGNLIISTHLEDKWKEHLLQASLWLMVAWRGTGQNGMLRNLVKPS